MTRFVQELIDNWRAAPAGRRAALLAFFCTALFVLVNWRNYIVDDIPQALLPVVLWREGTVRLDTYRFYYEELKRKNQHYAFTEAGPHLYPRNSVYVGLLVAPLYLPPIVWGVPTNDVRFWMGWGTITAAVWTAVAVAFSYLAARRWGPPQSPPCEEGARGGRDEGPALGFSLLLAFGTCLWTVVGHAIYDHLGGVVCVAVLVWLLGDFPLSPPRAALAAFLAGTAVGMRPCTVILLFPLGIYLFCWPTAFAGWKARLAALAGILVVPLSNAWLNAFMFGKWYQTGYPDELATDWGNPWWEGLSGLLIAPNSGLFTQSPFTLLAVVGGWAAWRRPAEVRYPGLLRAYTLCFVGYWVLFAHRVQWQGGLDFATRYLSEGYPLWLPLVMVGWNRVRGHPLAVPLVTAAAVWSVLYQVANIATFDAVITERNPLHYPWFPRHHFVMMHVDEWGIAATARKLAGTLLQLGLCAAATVYVLKPFVAVTQGKQESHEGGDGPNPNPKVGYD